MAVSIHLVQYILIAHLTLVIRTQYTVVVLPVNLDTKRYIQYFLSCSLYNRQVSVHNRFKLLTRKFILLNIWNIY